MRAVVQGVPESFTLIFSKTRHLEDGPQRAPVLPGRPRDADKVLPAVVRVGVLGEDADGNVVRADELAAPLLLLLGGALGLAALDLRRQK